MEILPFYLLSPDSSETEPAQECRTKFDAIRLGNVQYLHPSHRLKVPQEEIDEHAPEPSPSLKNAPWLSLYRECDYAWEYIGYELHGLGIERLDQIGNKEFRIYDVRLPEDESVEIMFARTDSENADWDAGFYKLKKRSCTYNDDWVVHIMSGTRMLSARASKNTHYYGLVRIGSGQYVYEYWRSIGDPNVPYDLPQIDSFVITTLAAAKADELRVCFFTSPDILRKSTYQPGSE